jgi:ankyrin repeat protein
LIPCAGADELLLFRSTISKFLSKLPSIFDTVRREALLEGREALVQYMFERDGIDVNAKIVLDRTWHDRTPLSLAAEKGHEAVVKLLLKWDNIEVNASDREGLTTLHFAASSGSAGTVRQLIHNGADLGTEDRCGERALHHAASGGH